MRKPMCLLNNVKDHIKVIFMFWYEYFNVYICGIKPTVKIQIYANGHISH